MAQLIDGHRSADQIVALLADEIPPTQTYFAIATLLRAGVIREGTCELPEREVAFWDGLAIDPADAAGAIASSPVSVVGIGDVDADGFAAALRELGLRVTADAERAVVLTDDYLRLGLDAFELEARQTGRSWLLVKPHGLSPWFGPAFRPDRPGCWKCLAHRLAGHRRVQRFLQDHSGRREPYPTARASIAASHRAVTGMVAALLQQWIAAPDRMPDELHVTSFDVTALTTTRHRLVARPQCPRCGDPEAFTRQQWQPIVLQSRPARARDGGQRSEDPHETFERLSHHISPITGIIDRLNRNSPPDSRLIFAYTTVHNFVHMTDNLDFLRISLRSYSGGKGRTDIQARTGALCESIERYSSVMQGDEARRSASYEQLLAEPDARVVHPNSWMLYSDAQLADRARWNSEGELFFWVPERFDEREMVEWSPAWSLVDGSQHLVPTDLCYYSGNSRFMRADSNGVAAGSSLEEAILQGFFELVERDAVALWWYNRLSVPRVDLASFGEPYFEAVVREVRARGRELWVLELPSDLEIPCFAAVSRRVDQGPEAIIFGFGAHFDASVAVARALTEHNQFVPYALVPDGPPTRVSDRWYAQATIAGQPYVAPRPGAPARHRTDYPTHDPHMDLRDAVTRCVTMARARGFDTLVQDHTRPDVDLAVARVIIPGLRHFWARF
ncbi:MAG TPA: TOMM precursor leader peptide-binding protein, partial [Enhygromyxa sp.]|nr:TOMM precursor leader peptide-binding protein [Enhygromyxa sp.]